MPLMVCALVLLLATGLVRAAEETPGERVVPAITLKPGKGLTLAFPNDSFSFTFRARVQFRASVFAPVTAEDGARTPGTEMVIRRARLVFTARAFKHWQLHIQLGMSNQDMEPDLRVPLRDAYLTYSQFRDANVRAGQMKVPFDRQRMVSSGNLQFTDRSIVVGELTLDRDVGVYLFSKDLLGLGGRVGYSVGLFGGDGRNRLSDAPGMLGVARLEIRPFGAFDDDMESSHEDHATPKLTLGAALARNQNTIRDRSTFGNVYASGGRTSFTHATVDLHGKWRGASFLTQGICRWADGPKVYGRRDGRDVTEPTRSACGGFFQAAYLVTRQLELAGRVGNIIPMGANSPGMLPSREVGTAVNLYAHGHELKLQGDYFYLFAADPRAGTHQMRIQLQMAL